LLRGQICTKYPDQSGIRKKPTSKDSLIQRKRKGLRIFVPDLAIGEIYWIAFELKIPDPVPTEPGRANLHYVDLKQNKATDQTLVFSEEARSIFPEMVIRHALALETSEVVYGALEYLYDKDGGSAVELLNRQADRLKETSRLTDGTELADDRVTLKKLSSLAKNLGLPRQSSDRDKFSRIPQYT